MTVTRSFALNHGLETAIAVAKRLQDEDQAMIEGVETDGDGTVIRLRIHAGSFVPSHRRRLELWSAFVERDVEARGGSAARREHRAIEPRDA